MAFGLVTTATIIFFIMFLPKVRQLNTMGVEGIYGEDDTPDGYANRYKMFIIHLTQIRELNMLFN